ncbi:HNH nuclease [Vibrio phage 1.097.O._10N.286.49.B3]|uniref:HNH nuclease n=1 Tax=Vibrio phage 1.097.O._10N.286.49.B3 TaxID=1881383 RepID=A0A2I7R0K9_9CAUD|nr:HNH nuclease [Vibrio phage 1.097.O._10N.286.49.B3]AUR87184.1 HNH nuclease [Vibrio phage 1.097.O._10N.286.49.B3]
MKPYEDMAKVVAYDPDTGDLTWLVDAAYNVKKGSKIRTKNTGGYLVFRYQGTLYLAHRVCWLLQTGEWPIEMLDHINGDKGDNRAVNLREVGAKGNAQNMKKYSTNTSGQPGVSKDTRGKWTVRLGKIHLGTHVDYDKAVAIRKAAEKIYGYHENHGRTT